MNRILFCFLLVPATAMASDAPPVRGEIVPLPEVAHTPQKCRDGSCWVLLGTNTPAFQKASAEPAHCTSCLRLASGNVAVWTAGAVFVYRGESQCSRRCNRRDVVDLDCDWRSGQ